MESLDTKCNAHTTELRNSFTHVLTKGAWGKVFIAVPTLQEMGLQVW